MGRFLFSISCFSVACEVLPRFISSSSGSFISGLFLVYALVSEPRSRLEDPSTLPVSLTDLWRQHGDPGQTPSRKIWEVKRDLIMGRRSSFFLIYY